MRGPPTDFWGKLSSSKVGAQTWHPLISHSADVAACTQRLLEISLLRRRLAAWGGLADLDESQVARLSAIAALHDLGKFNYGFQNKAHATAAFVNGHVNEVLALFGDAHPRLQSRLLEALPTVQLEDWGPNGGAFALLAAAIGHHGRPAVGSGVRMHPAAWAPGVFGDPFVGIERLHIAIQSWFPSAFAPSAAPLPTVAAFQHGFAGLVMLADWLGSDTSLFPYEKDGADPHDRMSLARAQAAVAVRAIGVDVTESRLALGPRAPAFDAISPFAPRPAQAAVLELPTNTHGSLTILEAETGSGKTEAALARFIRLFHAGTVDGLVFALPTRTAATQLHRRVWEAVQRAFPEHERPAVVLAVPGYLRFDDTEGRRLPGFEVLWNDHRFARDRHRGWAAEQPKRYLAGTIVVGTIDQVLLSTLMVGHAHMRATCLARQLLVVDEVHASDSYMLALLESVLRFHLAAGGHAFLMSATLGSSGRARLLATARPSDRVVQEPFERAVEQPYPALVHVESPAAARSEAIAHTGAGKQVQLQVVELADDPRAIAAMALDAAGEGACVLVVRNLVRDCMATQLALEQLAAARGCTELLFAVEGVVAPHHSRYAREDRRALDDAVEATFGKQRSVGAGKVLVATQTVEQSLDLDADLLVSDLCPMDVLLQRIGRLHRHQRGRPGGYERARTIVVAPEGRALGHHIRRDATAAGPHGYGTVYADLRILAATLRACERHECVDIPRDNRSLVEATTHAEVLRELAEDLGPAWVRHGEQIRGDTLGQRRLADMVLIDRALPFDDDAVRFPSPEAVGKIATRLGEDDRLINFTTPMPGPFGRRVSRVTLPHFLFGGLPADPLVSVSATVLADGSLRFQYGDTTYAYDRLGLRPETDHALDREGE